MNYPTLELYTDLAVLNVRNSLNRNANATHEHDMYNPTYVKHLIWIKKVSARQTVIK